MAAWADYQVEELKRLFDLRLSGSQIASQMGVTRNMVIGKLHRMGLSLEKARIPDEERHEREKARAKRKAAHEKVKYYSRTNRMMPDAPPIVAEPGLQFEGRLNIPTRDLRDYSNKGANQCRFIADEPPGPDYLACGNETPAGESYCPHCRKLTRSNSTLTQEERALHIRQGTRNHLRLVRKAA